MASNSLLKAVREVYGGITPPFGVVAMPTLYLGVSKDDVPQGVGYPRAVIEFSGEQPVDDSYDATDELPSMSTGEFIIRFYVENDSDIAESLARAVMTIMKPSSLSLTFYSMPRIFRTRYRVLSLGERSDQDKPVYLAEISYRVDFATDY